MGSAAKPTCIHFHDLTHLHNNEADSFFLSRKSKEVLESYGPGVQARQILIARRLVERGVRFVQLWHGAGQPWDNHDDIEVNHRSLAEQCDRAIGALLSDLKRLGLLEETLVICGGEFGRTPTVELPQAAPTPARSTAETITTGDSPSGWLVAE